jgi:hypothetical protein
VEISLRELESEGALEVVGGLPADSKEGLRVTAFAPQLDLVAAEGEDVRLHLLISNARKHLRLKYYQSVLRAAAHGTSGQDETAAARTVVYGPCAASLLPPLPNRSRS